MKKHTAAVCGQSFDERVRMGEQLTPNSSMILEIRELLETTRKNVAQQVNTQMLTTYWNIGRIIVEYEQQNQLRAEYGKQTLRELSKELTREFGKGFSRSNLQNMRAFYLAYEKCQTVSGKLSWSHYCELLSITDENKRSFYETMCIRDRLCAGDPRIKERMELDVEVSKLKMLRAAHQSSLYRLQDFVTITGPVKIQEAQQIIDGLKADVATAAAHPVPEEGFVGMTVQGQSFDKRALAGEALALAAKKVTSQEFQPVAEYRGFYVGAKVDFWTQELQVRLMGTLTYSCLLYTSSCV